MKRFSIFFSLAFLSLLFTKQAAAANFTVTRIDDRNTVCVSGVDCSLREAVAAANLAATSDSINFADPLIGQTITLGNEITIANNGALTITGRGANQLTVNGGAGTNRIFSIAASAVVTITDITLTGGNGTGASTSGGGGAVFADLGSTLTVNRVHVTGNTAANGGGINSQGTLVVRNSTVSNNQGGNNGGGIFTRDATIVNSTISDNKVFSAFAFGGGLYISGSVSIRNTTITANRVQLPALRGKSAEQLGNAFNGGGIYVTTGGTLNMANTIVSANFSADLGQEIYTLVPIVSGGDNLVGDFEGDSTNTGAAVTYQMSDIRDTNPFLGELGNNGGTTPTHALIQGSPAIDNGNNAQSIDPSEGNAPLRRDQRYYLRYAEGGVVTCAALENLGNPIVDIGALEFNAAPTAASVSISGKVTFSRSSQTSRAKVLLTDASGNVKTALVNPFGYYRFDNIAAGQIVTVQVSAKGASFDPQIISVTQDVEDLNFSAQ